MLPSAVLCKGNRNTHGLLFKKIYNTITDKRREILVFLVRVPYSSQMCQFGTTPNEI